MEYFFLVKAAVKTAIFFCRIEIFHPSHILEPELLFCLTGRVFSLAFSCTLNFHREVC